MVPVIVIPGGTGGGGIIPLWVAILEISAVLIFLVIAIYIGYKD